MISWDKMRLISFYLFAFLLFGCFRSSQLPECFIAKVIGVRDGDTIEVLAEDKPLIVRLADIDCPEKGQPFGLNAKKFTSNFCFGKHVTISSKGKYDRYHRLIATIAIDDVLLNETLLVNGFAWHFKKYSDNGKYAELEKRARTMKAGLWADSLAIAPWDWRHRKQRRSLIEKFSD